MERLQEALAAEIRKLRRNLHVDQEELATRVGVTRSSISNIEACRQAVSLEMFVKLAQALNQDPATLLNTVRAEASVTVSHEDVKDKNILLTIQATLNKPTTEQ